MLRALMVLLAASATVLAGCTANPPPPIESTDSPKTTPAKPGKNTVVVAIDDIGIGFNPHLRSDQSPATSAVSSMVLPSPFRPVPSPSVPGATDWVPDTALVTSAEVTSQEPFTITYTLRNQANWSDGAPIAAEDFRFLWQQMLTQPGVADSAAYRLISDVNSSGGGKTVTVVLTQPYPAWRELFANLLPSHLIKDQPGGFANGLAEGIPVSGGNFAIKSVDPGRDEILLERNDRYWGTPAAPDQILLRRGGTPAQLAESLRTGDAQMALVHGGVATQAQLAAIPSVRTVIMPQSRELQFVLNGRTTELADPRVRRGLLALLDPALLATVGAQTGGWVEPVRAQILTPSDPGYAPTAPPRPTADEAFALLAEAGFARAPEPPPVISPTSPAPQPRPIAKNGKTLAVRIGAVTGDATALAVANTAADQLRSAGIDASVRSLAADELYGKELVEGGVDAIVGWEVAGADPATVLASRYSCPPQAPGLDDGEAQAAVEAARRAPSNLSGVCDPVLQPAIDAALRGIDVPKVLADAEPALWGLATVLPIVQDNVVAAAGPRVDGASLSGAIQVGIFGDASMWRRIP
ncbi:ABC-type transport system, substrate-binding protein [Nocardia amikacinitolerans]|uniref:ABC-type transport system, substrate-binding protein n=1 Tax=Nocardia amikacinitolerans TaxID=756689 RepID=A0A285L8H4_9NOCA|nr:ABC transporter family substrate-binding protein [Nocardia amikacinitolerans]MCP2274976.1 ABC-type transport system, substrate-binding protein [Nocardia amikacinitolerans]MCP2296281.1 ABC-type transport system, substrate-binding protein [Nocardia amikacinitolerans]SNY80763.1 ABC-type transport system, substrate-binding protein [Nocardia amikacinitolerans]